ncbi:MAG: flagellin [Actinomycetota bacterium]|nr:flagellin [Actinomycetota bacterium]
MGMQINTNVSALNTYRNLTATQNSLGKSLEKLSSGLRINRASDDAAGLVISEGLKAQIGGLQVASRNAQDGISVVQTAEGALGTAQSILQRMRDLAVQAGNDSNSTEARAAIKAEADSLSDELTRISQATKFNGTKLLDASTASLTFQVGADGDTTSQISVDLSKADLKTLATTVKALTYDSATNAQAAITSIDTQLTYVSSARASFGAVQNRFEAAVSNISVAIENLSASKSRITDVDMASEMVNYTRAQILSQSGTAMLAQANSAPQLALQLLQG